MPEKKPISRQRKWQLDRVARGLCALCGEPRKRYGELCDRHQNEKMAKRRQKTIDKARVAG